MGMRSGSTEIVPGRSVRFIDFDGRERVGVFKKEDPWGGWIVTGSSGREHWVTDFARILIADDTVDGPR